MQIWIAVLGFLMFAGAISVLFQKSIKNAVITFGAVSLISSLMFALMKAYDVAVAEASIGSVLTTVIFFWTVRRIEEDGFNEKK